MSGRVLKIIGEIIPGADIDSHVHNSDWDSIKHLQIILELEGEFGISFTPAEISIATSVKKLIELVEEKTNAL